MHTVAVTALPKSQTFLNQTQDEPSNMALVRQLLSMNWKYRRKVVLILTIQIVMLAMMLCGLRLAGLGIDVIRKCVEPNAALPNWPLGLVPPDHWPNMTVVPAIAAAIVAMAMTRSALLNRYTTAVSDLVQRHVVVALRTQVYDKLRRLSFRDSSMPMNPARSSTMSKATCRTWLDSSTRCFSIRSVWPFRRHSSSSVCSPYT